MPFANGWASVTVLEGLTNGLIAPQCVYNYYYYLFFWRINLLIVYLKLSLDMKSILTTTKKLDTSPLNPITKMTADG